MSSSSDHQITDGSRRRKRVITDARKVQNRTAQQLYRQRQMECRAQTLEKPRHGLSGKFHQLKPRQSRGTAPGGSGLMTITLDGATTEIQTQSISGMLPCEDSLQTDPACSLESDSLMQGFIPNLDSNIDELLSLPMTSPSFFPSMDSGLWSDSVYSGNPSGTSHIFLYADGVDRVIRPLASKFADVALRNTFPIASSSSSIWPASMNGTSLGSYSSDHLQPSLPVSMQDWAHPSQTLEPHLLEDYHDSQNPLKNAPFNQIPGAEEIIYSTAIFVYGCQILPGPRAGSTNSLPDPYINAILCSLGATLLAYFHNAHCIGLEHQDILINRSPFYKPNTTMSDDTQALLAAARKPWIPLHLQPTLPQILFPHHPYLDLLPFPTLRARAITFGATSPQFFDWMELKKDVFRDGLYCFRDHDRGGSKQPWDVQSWEAAPWFSGKWRLLME